MLKKFLSSIIFLSLFAVFSFAANNRFTLVIDAGHGGKDHGAPGLISKEKDLALKFAMAFGKLVETNCPDVRVVYTRKTDIFLPLSERAEIANRNKADLFISIHINSVEGNKKVRGFQTYTLGRGRSTGERGIKQNLEVAKRENSVIYLEKNYKKTYKGFDPNSAESDIIFEFVQDKNRERSVELAKQMQRYVPAATGLRDMGAHQNNLAVLRLTSMPACLIELGFISNPDEENFMNSPQAASLYAKGIYNAFVTYKNKYDTNFVVPYKIDDSPMRRDTLEVESPKSLEKNEKEPAEKIVEETQPVVVKAREKIGVAKKKEEAVVQNVDMLVPVFKIQICASSMDLAPNNKVFKGLSPVDKYMEGDLYKYTYGASNDYMEILKLRREILDKFPDAFVIAFKGGEKVNITRAIQEYKKNKKK